MPANLDHFQSQALVGVVGLVLAGFCVYSVKSASSDGLGSRASLALIAGVVSLTFAAGVWALRAATPFAAICGGGICFLLAFWTSDAGRNVGQTALTPLMLLFVLTFLATRLGKRQRPEFTSGDEMRRGRRASQVIANLGFAPLPILAGLTSFYDRLHPNVSGLISGSAYFFPVLVLAALAEATADTVSSELGQAFGGTPWMVTTLRRVPAGTDGAVSGLGTVAGVVGAALVTAAGAWSMRLDLRQAGAALAGGVGGLLFDSVLGATVERRGWVNNDLVNFASTAFAAGVALVVMVV